jgi:ABC-type transport system involved in multi-copper enzyme maturation permease subunit
MSFGPHFYFDLVRLARKRRNVALRVGYLAALLLGWWLVWENAAGFTGHINDFANLAANYTRGMLIFQYALLLFLTPMYLAGSVIEEKENRTLELLYQTHLTDGEILLGKFSARVVHLVLLSISSMPLLAIISLWGGVSLELLGLHFAFSILLIILIGNVSLFASVQAYSMVDALIISYAFVFIIAYTLCFVAPMLYVIGSVPMWYVYVGFLILAVLMLLVSAGLFWLSLRQFRRLRDLTWTKDLKTVTPTQRPLASEIRRRRRERKAPPIDSTPRPAVPDNAMLWKEMQQSRFAGSIPHFLTLGAFAFACIFAIVHGVLHWGDFGQEEIELVIKSFYCGGLFYLVGLVFLLHAFQSTSVVAREREANTLDFLLLLPDARHELLFWKWLGPWMRNRVMVGVMIAAPIVAMLSGILSVRAGLVVLILPWPALLFINQLGLMLSVFCRRVVVANVTLIGILLGLFLIHVLYWHGFETLLRGYIDLMGGEPQLDDNEAPLAMTLMAVQQSLLVLGAIAFTAVAFWRFNRRTDEARTQVW